MILKTDTKEYEELLADIKRIYEKRSGKTFTREELELFARRLARFGAVIHNFHSKQKGKEPRYIL